MSSIVEFVYFMEPAWQVLEAAYRNYCSLPLSFFAFCCLILHRSLGNYHTTKSNSTKLCVVSQLNSSQLITNYINQHEHSQPIVSKGINSASFVSASSDAFQTVDAPLVNALQISALKNSAGFHFPGHNRGQAAPPSLTNLIGVETFAHDLPELPELDDLFSPKGAILEAQQKAAVLFGASKTWFLVGGSTCGVQASVMATCSPGDSLILPRNSHISAMSAMVLSGALPRYIIPEYNSDWDISGGITSLQVKKEIDDLQSEGRRIGAVLITSPTYHGICSDLKSISELCHLHNIPLIVDEAHGAHFKFHPLMPPTAIEQGADLAIHSTHKVLSSLTQSSMLHMSGYFVDEERISQCLQILQSTSPNYLLLASLDAARAQLSQNPDTIFNEAMDLALGSKMAIEKISGILVMAKHHFPNSTFVDPLRLTVGLWGLGPSGYEADDFLCDKHGVITELAGTRSITLAISLGTSREHTRRLEESIVDLSRKNWNADRARNMESTGCTPFAGMCLRLNPRDAFFAGKRRVNVKDSIGLVCGECISSYPPGIPVLIPGEIITEDVVSYLLDIREKGATISGAADPELGSIIVCK